MSTSDEKIIQLLERIALAVERLVPDEPVKKRRKSQDELVVQAVLAISQGADSMRQVAKACGVSFATVDKIPQIKRALAMQVVDRRVSKDVGDHFEYEEC